ncbi:hypothetical protein TUZN_1267 [Thermoproteus uzoniensis 768-20]|uniref:Uncharacterized protein n=2 Tax=Thermoproteus TaxID=2270 RepID=F2L0S8_THEU7|nr:hypothetical protein TUZN_1267 [Thermoproteus uzoniensis 768-20]
MLDGSMLGLAVWALLWLLALWGSLTLLKGRPVNPLLVLLAAVLAPILFVLGAAAGLFVSVVLAAVFPPLLLLAVPAAFLLGVLLALGAISALTGVGLLRALAAVLLATLITALASYLIWHTAIPPQIPRPAPLRPF